MRSSGSCAIAAAMDSGCRPLLYWQRQQNAQLAREGTAAGPGDEDREGGHRGRSGLTGLRSTETGE